MLNRVTFYRKCWGSEEWIWLWPPFQTISDSRQVSLYKDLLNTLQEQMKLSSTLKNFRVREQLVQSIVFFTVFNLKNTFKVMRTPIIPDILFFQILQIFRSFSHSHGIFCAQSLGQNFDLVTANPPCAAHRRDREGWKWLLRVSQWEVKKRRHSKDMQFSSEDEFCLVFSILDGVLFSFVPIF